MNDFPYSSVHMYMWVCLYMYCTCRMVVEWFSGWVGHAPRHLHVHVVLIQYMYTCKPGGYRQDPGQLEAHVLMYMYMYKVLKY